MNKKTRHIIFFSLIGLQILFLVFIVIYKEYLMSNSISIRLEVLPVDPRDLFTGEYVNLNYKISNLPEYMLSDCSPNKTVYVYLEKYNSFYEPVSAFFDKPEADTDKVYITGKCISEYGNIEYGIEQFFTPEGKAMDIQNAFIDHEVSAEVLLDSNGDAILKRLFIDNKPVDFNE